MFGIRGTRRRLWGLALLANLLLMATLVCLHQLAKARSQLGDAQKRLSSTQDELTEALEELEVTRRRLTQDACDTTLPTTTTTTEAPWKNWKIAEGNGCEFHGPDCMQTVDFGTYRYSAFDSCRIETEINVTLILKFEHFETERGYDYLTVGSLRFSGSSLPKDLPVEGGTDIEWLADYSVQKSGWRMCIFAPCSEDLCPPGFFPKAGATCGNTTCVEDDILTCCEARSGCTLPANLRNETVRNETVYDIPPDCGFGDQHFIENCPISCGGEMPVADGWQLPQLCVGSSDFQLPSCQVATNRPVPWHIEGPCQLYGEGCVSSPGVGASYGSNEGCRISVEDSSAYRIWVTFFDSEELYDTLLITNPVEPGENCAYIYFYYWCYYFLFLRPADDPMSGALVTEAGQDPLGPWPFSTMEWSSDTTIHGMGFIACVQGRCSTMTCPEGYYFNCLTEEAWCQRHVCLTEVMEDVDTCCLAVTEAWIEDFNISASEASTSEWCPYFAMATTTTTTTPPPDYIGELVLEIVEEEASNGNNSNGNNSGSMDRNEGNSSQNDSTSEATPRSLRVWTAEEIVTVIEQTLIRLASVDPGAVAVTLKTLENQSLDVAFRVQESRFDLRTVSDEELLDELNVNTTLFAAMLLRTTMKVDVSLDPFGHRPYGSLCNDLYGCTSTALADCWKETYTGQSCAALNMLQFCVDDLSLPGPGFYWWYSLSPAWLIEYWWAVWWLPGAGNAGFGPEKAVEVCCTCGGGTCAPGTYKFVDTAPAVCTPCLPGTSSNPLEEPSQCFGCPSGRFTDRIGAPECLLCSAGRFGSDEGMSECPDCNLGSIAATRGETACATCTPGRYSDNRVQCNDCTEGKFAGSSGQSACDNCPPGQYMPSQGATECLACDNGTYTGTGGRTICDPCGVGEFAAEEGQSACDNCPQGEAQSREKSVDCEECAEGQFAQQIGQSLCNECPLGMEALATGASACDRCDPGFFRGENEMNCTSCPAGTRASEPGLTACRACDLGEHTNTAEDATGCVFCELGTFASRQGLTACEYCRPGSYSEETGLSSCADCIPGDYANVTGLSGCSACPPGTITNLEGLSACILCSAGQEAPSSGGVECRLCEPGLFSAELGTPLCGGCPPGTYSPIQGSTACIACGIGRFSADVGWSECQLCKYASYATQTGMTGCTGCNETLPGVGEYWTTMTPPTTPGTKVWTPLLGAVNVSSCGCRPGTQPVGPICEPCGEGLICLGMGVLDIEEGYDWDDEYSVWDCSLGIEDACPGGEPGRCMPGRDETSVGCSLCLDKMVPESDGSCVECRDADFAVPSLVGLVALAIVIICYCLFDSPRRKRPKLSFLLIVASAGQLVTIVQQLGIVSLIRVNWTNPLLQAFNVIGSVSFFDVQVLRPSCVFIMDVVTMYTVRVGAVFISLVAVCFAHLVSQLTQHRQTWRTRWPSLWSALGTIVSTFFVSILSTMLGPLQCKLHPNSRQTVSWYPSVTCWEGGDHTTMIIIGSIACLLPVVFLVSCLWAVHNFRKKLLSAEVTFMNRWSFLFFRYTPELYWYGPITLVRNALVSCCPVMVSPILQILALEVIVLCSLCLLLCVLPWRVPKANYLDAICHMCLLLVTMLASFFVEDEDTHIVSVLGLLFICSVPIVVLGFLSYGIMLLLQSVKKPFQFFLCHHKMGAGCFCRLVKMWLLREIKRKVFIDSDDLKNLDRLFDVVAHETETLVGVYSQALLTRPWCVGEITTAHKSRIKLMPVYFPGVNAPTDDFIENFLKYVPDISCLTQFSIDLSMIQEALKWFGETTHFTLSEELHEVALGSFTRHLIAGKVSNAGLSGRAPVKHELENRVIVVCNKLDYEAASSAFLLVSLFNPLVQHSDNAMAHVLAIEDNVPSHVNKGMLICTNGMLTRRVIEVLFACQDHNAFILPIMNVTNFIFPSVDWMQAQSTFLELEEEQRERAILMVQAIFLEIAVDFQPSALSGTEATLKTKAQEIANRLLKTQQQPSDGIRGSRRDSVGSTLSLRKSTSISKTASNRVSKTSASSARVSGTSGGSLNLTVPVDPKGDLTNEKKPDMRTSVSSNNAAERWMEEI